MTARTCPFKSRCLPIALLLTSCAMGASDADRKLLVAARDAIAVKATAFRDQAKVLEAKLAILESQTNLEAGLDRARSIDEPYYASLALGGIAAVQLPLDREASEALFREALKRAMTIERHFGDQATSLPLLFELVPSYPLKQAHDLLAASEEAFDAWPGEEPDKGKPLLAFAKAATAVTPFMARPLLVERALTSNHFWEAIEYLGTVMARQNIEDALKLAEELYEAKKNWPNEQYFLRAVLIELARTDFPRAFEGIKKMRDPDREIAAVKLAEALLAAERKKEAREVITYIRSLESEFNWTQQSLAKLKDRLKAGKNKTVPRDIVTPELIDAFLRAPSAEAWRALPWVRRVIFRDEPQVRQFMAAAPPLTESIPAMELRHVSQRSIVFGPMTIGAALLGQTDRALELAGRIGNPVLRTGYLLDAYEHIHPMPPLVSNWSIRSWRRVQVSIQTQPTHPLEATEPAIW